MALTLIKSIKKILDHFPGLRKNKLYFNYQKKRQNGSCSYRPGASKYPEIVSAIAKDGITIIEDFCSGEMCEKIIAEFNPHYQNIISGSTDYSIYHSDIGTLRLNEANKYSLTADREFFSSSMIRDIGLACVHPQAGMNRKIIDYKTEVGKTLQAELPHFDDWRYRFKAFLYLTDVGPENAPFVYYKGTHLDEPWRYRYDYEFEKDGPHGRFGHFFLQEWEWLQQAKSIEKIVCTGKAGTLILADFRGVHAGTQLRSGKRILLNATFDMTKFGIF